MVFYIVMLTVCKKQKTQRSIRVYKAMNDLLISDSHYFVKCLIIEIRLEKSVQRHFIQTESIHIIMN